MAAKRGKAAKGHSHAEALPPGTEVAAGSGSCVRKWSLGPAVGKGGFGCIYSAREVGPSSAASAASAAFDRVVKVEPHGNGPLFVEVHFYMKNAKRADLDAFASAHGLRRLGMPEYVASGTLDRAGQKYRFLVTERFGGDLWSEFLRAGRSLPSHTVFRIALQMIDVYQYIHARGYVHADLKASNILLGRKRGAENQTYLVDFGLASQYATGEFKRNPKRAHDGTAEYTSRDAHDGVPTRRGDMEILGYNLVHWLSGKLPWEDALKSPAAVQSQKERCMADVPQFLKKAFGAIKPPGALKTYLEYVSGMKHDDAPDYEFCRRTFRAALKSSGHSLDCKLEFAASGDDAKPPKRTKKAPRAGAEENDSEEEKSPDVPKAPRRKKAPDVVTSPDPDGPPENGTSTNPPRVSKRKQPSPRKKISDTERSSDDGVPSKDDTVCSVDIFEDSCVETPPKRGRKAKHTKRFEVQYCTDEEVTVHTVVKKKSGAVKQETRSWRKCPTILNGHTVKK